MSEETQEINEQATEETNEANDSLLNMVGEEGSKPEYLPDELWDAEAKSVKTDALLSAYEQEAKKAKGLRDKLAKGGEKAPESADKYELEADLPDEEANYIKEVAFELGFSNEKLNKFMGKMLEKYGIEQEETVDTAEVMKQKMAKLGDSAPQIIRAVSGWKNGLLAKGLINEEEAKVIEKMATSAASVSVLNKLRYITTGGDIPIKDSYSDGLPSDSEIYAMMGTDEYKKGNPETIRKVDELLSKREQVGRPAYLQL